MIERIKVTNFQSLAEADVELGKLTVIVGPSNSGKSALLRALKAVVRNVNSPSAVRAGQTMFTSQIVSDGVTVALERGKSHSTYKVITQDGEDVYTKAGRDVPEEVQRVLRAPKPEGPDLIFSSQIDPPFLLSETGSVVAKMLGDLTNVSRLHAASKEANRRRLDASKVQRIRVDDARACLAKLSQDYGDLAEHKQRLTQARELVSQVQQDGRLVEKVTEILERLEVIETSERSLLRQVESLPQPADIEREAERAGELLGQAHAFDDAVKSLDKLQFSEAELFDLRKLLTKAEEEAEAEFHKILQEAGKCPTCGANTAA